MDTKGSGAARRLGVVVGADEKQMIDGRLVAFKLLLTRGGEHVGTLEAIISDRKPSRQFKRYRLKMTIRHA